MAKKSISKKKCEERQEKPHHHKPDCKPKFIRLLVCQGILSPIDGYTYDSVFEHFNFKEGQLKECFLPWEVLGRKLKRSIRTVKDSVNRLVLTGIFNEVRYRVIENDCPQNKYHDFDTYGEAESKHNQLIADGLTSQTKPNPLITPTGKLLEMEDFGIKCIDNNRHIYRKMTPVETKRWSEKKTDRGIGKKLPAPNAKNSSKVGQKLIVNETYSNETELNDKFIIKNKFDSLESIMTVSPQDLKDLVKSFCEEYEERNGCSVPKGQTAHLEDEVICENIRSNLQAVIDHGGTPEGWVKNDFERLDKHKNSGTYNPPNIKFFSFENSLQSYLGILEKEKAGISKSKSMKTNGSPSSTKDGEAVSSEDGVLSIEHRVRLKTALSKPNTEAITATETAVRKVFRAVGENDSAFEQVIEMIERRFQKNEQSRRLGDAVLGAAEKSYRSAMESLKESEWTAKREKMEKEKREKRSNSPEKTDDRCRNILHLLMDYPIEDIGDEEIRYFIGQVTDYWGEDYVQKNFTQMLAYLNRGCCVDDDDDIIPAVNEQVH